MVSTPIVFLILIQTIIHYEKITPIPFLKFNHFYISVIKYHGSFD